MIMLMPRGWSYPSTPFAIVVAWLALGAPCHTQAPTRSPQDLQQALQRRYDLILDFSADFIHTYESGMLRTRLVERGTMLIKKPGRMRWDYLPPDRKLYLSDGERLYSYWPEDRQGMILRLPDENEATTPALFLAGVGSFVDDFTAAYDTVEDQPPDSYVLRLTPIRTERDFEFLTLVIDAATLAIVRLISRDLQGGISTFVFSNLHENLGLSDTPFTFKFPPGTDVDDTTRTDTRR